MRLLIANALTRLACWLRPKAVPAAVAAGAARGSTFVDAYRKHREPTQKQLLEELKNTAWSCASINAAVCASFPPKLYAGTRPGEARPRCLTRPLSRAQERGLNVAGELGMLLTFNLIYAVFSGPLGALSDRIGRQRLITTGWLVFGVIYLGFAVATTAWQTWVLFGVYGLYYALVEGSAKAFVADLVPPDKRGTAYGFYNAAVGLSAFPASLLAGIFWKYLGPSAPFVVGAVLAVTAAILLRVWRGLPALSPA